MLSAGEPLHLGRGVELAQTDGDVEAAGEAQRRGHAFEQLLEGAEPDELEHRRDLAVGMRDVVRHWTLKPLLHEGQF